MKKQVIINGIVHFFLSGYDWSKCTETLAHPLGIAFVSNDGRLGFVQHLTGWLMFKVSDYA